MSSVLIHKQTLVVLNDRKSPVSWSLCLKNRALGLCLHLDDFEEGKPQVERALSSWFEDTSAWLSMYESTGLAGYGFHGSLCRWGLKHS